MPSNITGVNERFREALKPLRWLSLCLVFLFLFIMHYREYTDLNVITNSWLLAGYAVSFLITFLIFISLFIEYVTRSKRDDDNDFEEKLMKGSFCALGSAVIALIVLVLSCVYYDAPMLTPILMYLSILLALAVAYVDKTLPGVWKELKTLDIAVFISLVVTSLSSVLLHRFIGTDFGQGFSSGAVEFQLIIANLVFDPQIYQIDKMYRLHKEK